MRTTNNFQAIVLLDELDALSHVAPIRGSKAGQQKTQLALVIHEVARVKAYLEVGIESLPRVAAKLGLKPDVVKKYRSAGARLYKKDRQLYDSFITAVADGTKRPALPGVSALKVQGSREKLLGPNVDGRLRRLIGEVSPRIANPMIQAEAYGGSDEHGRASLSAIDKFIADALRIMPTLNALGGGVGGSILPSSLLERRLSDLISISERLLASCASLRVAQYPLEAAEDLSFDRASSSSSTPLDT